jgi:hypothetical protein
VTDTAVLRESSETAARERVRLETAVGRSRAAALAARVPVIARHLGSEEAARSGLRYQPVVWTVIVVAAVAFFWPGRPDSPTAPAAATAFPPRTAVVPTTTPTTAAPASPTPAPVAPLAPARPLPSRPATTTATTAAPAAPAPAPSPAPVVALSVREFGWAAALSGSGLSTADVPEGTMPVANRLGQLDKVSFVRLDGTDTTLTLREDAAGAREAVGAALVVACPITDPSWVAGPDQSLDDAPSWDDAACVAGSEADGAWTFDLSRFDGRDGPTGFALVPATDAPADFQVTFAAS